MRILIDQGTPVPKIATVVLNRNRWRLVARIVISWQQPLLKWELRRGLHGAARPP
jgi:hypothetical protein